MKKVLMLIVCAAFLATPAFAGKPKNLINDDPLVGNPSRVSGEAGAKLDAPNLVKLPWNLALGVEAGKSLYDNNSREGYFFYGKLTYTGTILDLSGKK